MTEAVAVVVETRPTLHEHSPDDAVVYTFPSATQAMAALNRKGWSKCRSHDGWYDRNDIRIARVEFDTSGQIEGRHLPRA